MRFSFFLVLSLLSIGFQSCFAIEEPPQDVSQLWADFDPRQEALDVSVIREWEEENIVIRYVTFHVGTFKGSPARIAGFYAFQKEGSKRPGLLHLHGGGQRAFLHEVRFYAKRGYACLSINWGGREMEEAKPDDPNTDWGAVDPTQNNVSGYFNLKPGPKYLDPFDSPRNNNWYLLTLAGRRGLTFLEQQPEVDSERLGVYGHSMGGNLTVYVAGSDTRVKAAAPSVGGSGFRNESPHFLPEFRPQLPDGDLKLFNDTLGFESYAPRIRIPILWLGATNDFHGIMDDTYRTGELIPCKSVQYVFTPHMNHRFTPDCAVARPLWFDQHLKGNFQFPEPPVGRLAFDKNSKSMLFEVTLDRPGEVRSVQVFYSQDPEPRARFWRSAETLQSGDSWSALMPLNSMDKPLFAFANVSYQIPSSDSEPYAKATEQLVLSTKLQIMSPEDLRKEGVVGHEKKLLLIEDFANGWRDWYQLSPDNPHHWEYSTRKLNDPEWRGESDAKLVLDVISEEENELVLVLTENFFRGYRGKQVEYLAVVKLAGLGQRDRVTLKASDFKSLSGEELANWDQIDLLSLRAYFEKEGKLFGSKSWLGPQPKFERLEWSLDR